MNDNLTPSEPAIFVLFAKKEGTYCTAKQSVLPLFKK
jgi:hypothetical protein